jgi:hypothetical protein
MPAARAPLMQSRRRVAGRLRQAVTTPVRALLRHLAPLQTPPRPRRSRRQRQRADVRGGRRPGDEQATKVALPHLRRALPRRLLRRPPLPTLSRHWTLRGPPMPAPAQRLLLRPALLRRRAAERLRVVSRSRG